MTTKILRSREEIRQLTMNQEEEERNIVNELAEFFTKNLTEQIMADEPKRFISKSENNNNSNFEVIFQAIKFYDKNVEASKVCKIGMLQAALEENFKPAGWDIRVRPYFHRIIVEVGEDLSTSKTEK